MNHDDLASGQLERARDAHERLKAIRIEYETARAASTFADSGASQAALLIRARYTKAVDEFFCE
jgi:hypothetical protein